MLTVRLSTWAWVAFTILLMIGYIGGQPLDADVGWTYDALPVLGIDQNGALVFTQATFGVPTNDAVIHRIDPSPAIGGGGDGRGSHLTPSPSPPTCCCCGTRLQPGARTWNPSPTMLATHPDWKGKELCSRKCSRECQVSHPILYIVLYMADSCFPMLWFFPCFGSSLHYALVLPMLAVLFQAKGKVSAPKSQDKVPALKRKATQTAHTGKGKRQRHAKPTGKSFVSAEADASGNEDDHDESEDDGDDGDYEEDGHAGDEEQVVDHAAEAAKGLEKSRLLREEDDAVGEASVHSNCARSVQAYQASRQKRKSAAISMAPSAALSVAPSVAMDPRTRPTRTSRPPVRYTPDIPPPPDADPTPPDDDEETPDKKRCKPCAKDTQSRKKAPKPKKTPPMGTMDAAMQRAYDQLEHFDPVVERAKWVAFHKWLRTHDSFRARYHWYVPSCLTSLCIERAEWVAFHKWLRTHDSFRARYHWYVPSCLTSLCIAHVYVFSDHGTGAVRLSRLECVVHAMRLSERIKIILLIVLLLLYNKFARPEAP